MKEEPSFGGAGIDVLREHFQSNATLADVSDSLDDLSQWPREPRELPHDQRVFFTQIFERRFQLGSFAM